MYIINRFIEKTSLQLTYYIKFTYIVIYNKEKVNLFIESESSAVSKVAGSFRVGHCLQFVMNSKKIM